MVVTALQIFDIFLGKFKVELAEITQRADRRFSFNLVGRSSFLRNLVVRTHKQIFKEEQRQIEMKEEMKVELPKDIDT